MALLERSNGSFGPGPEDAVGRDPERGLERVHRLAATANAQLLRKFGLFDDESGDRQRFLANFDNAALPTSAERRSCGQSLEEFESCTAYGLDRDVDVGGYGCSDGLTSNEAVVGRADRSLQPTRRLRGA